MSTLVLVSACHTSNQGGTSNDNTYNSGYNNSPVIQTNTRGGSGMNLAPNQGPNNQPY